MMKFFTSVLLVILFTNVQAFAGSCTNLCMHDKNPCNNRSQINSQVFDHACCDTEEEQSHDCNPKHCTIPMPADENPILTAKSGIKKNLISSDPTVETGTQFRSTTISNKALFLNRSNTHNLISKAPLYIYYQKLLE